MIRTVFIVGPTASGKTALSIELAKQIDGEIVSADSMQIYKGIHIASAAPDENEKNGIPHHMLEFLEPNEEYSVADYVLAAREIIKDIKNRGKAPIVVGGTGLYISALADNTEFTDEETDFSLRQELTEKFELIGGERMLKELAEFDPETANRLHPNNKRRIIRAFEVYRLTGKTVTEQNELSHKGEALIEPLLIGITYSDREKLYDRINRRVDLMIENGLLEEAKKALEFEGGAIQAIGHKELSAYINGRSSLNDALENLKMQTRRYAKRQLTWFNRDKRINWFFADLEQNPSEKAIYLAKEFLKEE